MPAVLLPMLKMYDSSSAPHQCRYDYSMGGGGVFGSEDEDEDEDEGPAAAAGGNSYDDSQQG